MQNHCPSSQHPFPCHQLGSRSVNFDSLLLREPLGCLVRHTTVTVSEQLWFHLVCLAMYTLFMKSSLFILLLPKTDSLVLIFVNLMKYSAMGLWQFENKKPSLQCTKPISPPTRSCHHTAYCSIRALKEPHKARPQPEGKIYAPYIWYENLCSPM